MVIELTLNGATNPALSITELPYDKQRGFTFKKALAFLGDMTIVLPILNGGVVDGINYPGFTYSDGTGKLHKYTASTAMCNNDRPQNIFTDSWEDLKLLADLDWGMINHGYWHGRGDVLSELYRNDTSLYDNTGYFCDAIQIPNADSGYVDTGLILGYKQINSQFGTDGVRDGRIPGVDIFWDSVNVAYNSTQDLDAMVVGQYFLSDGGFYSGGKECVDTSFAKTGGKWIAQTIAHDPGDGDASGALDFAAMVQYIHDHPLNNDSVWFCSTKQILDWLDMRRHSVVTQSYNSTTKKLTLNINLAGIDPATILRNLSFRLNSGTITSATITSGADEVTFNGTLLNVYKRDKSFYPNPHNRILPPQLINIGYSGKQINLSYDKNVSQTLLSGFETPNNTLNSLSGGGKNWTLNMQNNVGASDKISYRSFKGDAKLTGSNINRDKVTAYIGLPVVYNYLDNGGGNDGGNVNGNSTGGSGTNPSGSLVFYGYKAIIANLPPVVIPPSSDNITAINNVFDNTFFFKNANNLTGAKAIDGDFVGSIPASKGMLTLSAVRQPYFDTRVAPSYPNGYNHQRPQTETMQLHKNYVLLDNEPELYLKTQVFTIPFPSEDWFVMLDICGFGAEAYMNIDDKYLSEIGDNNLRSTNDNTQLFIGAGFEMYKPAVVRMQWTAAKTLKLWINGSYKGEANTYLTNNPDPSKVFKTMGVGTDTNNAKVMFAALTQVNHILSDGDASIALTKFTSEYRANEHILEPVHKNIRTIGNSTSVYSQSTYFSITNTPENTSLRKYRWYGAGIEANPDVTYNTRIPELDNMQAWDKSTHAELLSKHIWFRHEIECTDTNGLSLGVAAGYVYQKVQDQPSVYTPINNGAGSSEITISIAGITETYQLKINGETWVNNKKEFTNGSILNITPRIDGYSFDPTQFSNYTVNNNATLSFVATVNS